MCLMAAKQWISNAMPLIVARTESYFREEFSIQMEDRSIESSDEVESLDIRGLTAVVGVGGPLGVLVAFSFDQKLIDELYIKMTDGLDISPSEEKMYRDSVAGDVVNNIVGNCTQSLASTGTSITLTPPMIVDHVKNIHRMRGAIFISRILDSDLGQVDIHLIAPGELFNNELDYKK